MTPGIGWQPDDAFLDRVKRAYRMSLVGWGGTGPSMWSGFARRQADVHDALLSDSNDSLRRIFSDPGTTDLYYGVDNLVVSLIEQHHKVWTGGDPEVLDLLARGAACFDAERPAVEIFDAALAQHVVFPNPFRGELGQDTERGRATYRAAQALYQAARIRTLVQPDARVVEIGPGMGRTAYYAGKSGLSYTTIDLPMGVVAQSCFLGATLGPDKIWLTGDPVESQQGRIRLLPASLGLPDERFDLVVNVDSMTEMSPHAALNYAQWIAGHATRFLSINHTDNPFTIDDICRIAVGSHRMKRRVYPLRPGYSEDLIEFGAPRAAWLAKAWMDAVLLARRARRRLGA